MHKLTRLPAILALVLSGLSGAASAGETPFRLGPNPVLGGGEYSTGGGITVAVELREMQGRTGLCGAWAQSERLTAYLRGAGREVLAKGSIALGREVLTYNFNFLHQIAPRDSYAGAPAGCVRLKRAWQPGDAAKPLDIRIPRRSLRFGNPGPKSGGFQVTFRDTGRVNPAMEAGSLLPKSWTSIHLTPTKTQ